MTVPRKLETFSPKTLELDFITWPPMTRGPLKIFCLVYMGEGWEGEEGEPATWMSEASKCISNGALYVVTMWKYFSHLSFSLCSLLQPHQWNQNWDSKIGRETLLCLLSGKATCPIMWSQNHFRKPNRHNLDFLHQNLLCGITYRAPLEILSGDTLSPPTSPNLPARLIMNVHQHL